MVKSARFGVHGIKVEYIRIDEKKCDNSTVESRHM